MGWHPSPPASDAARRRCAARRRRPWSAGGSGPAPGRPRGAIPPRAPDLGPGGDRLLHRPAADVGEHGADHGRGTPVAERLPPFDGARGRPHGTLRRCPPSYVDEQRRPQGAQRRGRVGREGAHDGARCHGAHPLGWTLRDGEPHADLQPERCAFELAPLDWSGAGANEYAYPWRRIDWPQRFGADGFTTWDLGQSRIAYDLSWARASFGNENLWWGPGIESGIIMSDNAPGFLHGSLSTNRPVDIGIGSLEAQWIWGGLAQSEYFDPALVDTDRFITGLVLAYSTLVPPGALGGRHPGLPGIRAGRRALRGASTCSSSRGSSRRGRSPRISPMVPTRGIRWCRSSRAGSSRSRASRPTWSGLVRTTPGTCRTSCSSRSTRAATRWASRRSRRCPTSGPSCFGVR